MSPSRKSLILWAAWGALSTLAAGPFIAACSKSMGIPPPGWHAYVPFLQWVQVTIAMPAFGLGGLLPVLIPALARLRPPWTGLPPRGG